MEFFFGHLPFTRKMEINKRLKLLVIPFFTLIFILMNMDLESEIYTYFDTKNLPFFTKSEPSALKNILLWNNSLENRDFLKGYKIV